MTNPKKKAPPNLAAFVQRGIDVEAAVKARMLAKLMHAPRDPGAVFEEVANMIQAGALDMARAVFLDDAETRARWNLMRGRMTEEEYARAEGRSGGQATGEGNKRSAGMSHVQERRAVRYRELWELKGDDTLRLMALEENVSESAIRQSLKAAGIKISTASRRGRQ